MSAKKAAKSRKSAKSAKSAKSSKAPKSASSTPEQNAEAERILGIWKVAVAGGLGGKQFESSVLTKYEPRLRENILGKLQKGDLFDAKAEEGSKTVAKDLGTVCAMFTTGPTVSKDTFQTVFLLMKTHPACPQETIKGRGAWCDIPL